ncbi:hypothetical protein ACMD2_22276 [Ananas comosus]|uniref:Uncharacterized protein n=1 Tax=Ananas comosus TaxID=4615 RepID=A0A199UE95_ANACO|nr:hypothetical protein ACMD2_22276 [Ananas comosus]
MDDEIVDFRLDSAVLNCTKGVLSIFNNWIDNDLSSSSSGFEIRECLDHLSEREWPLWVQKRLHLPTFEIRVELRQDLPIGRDDEYEARGRDWAYDHHDAAPFFHCFHRSFALTCYESPLDRAHGNGVEGNALFRWQRDLDDPHTFMDLLVSTSKPMLRLRSCAYYPRYRFEHLSGKYLITEHIKATSNDRNI